MAVSSHGHSMRRWITGDAAIQVPSVYSKGMRTGSSAVSPLVWASQRTPKTLEHYSAMKPRALWRMEGDNAMNERAERSVALSCTPLVTLSSL